MRFQACFELSSCRRFGVFGLAGVLWLVGTAGPAWATEAPLIEHTIAGSFEGANSVVAADIDEDGDTDIIGAANVDGVFTWWENPGGADTTNPAAWTGHAIDNAGGIDATVFAADVDGDGDTDVLVASRDTPKISWWQNPGGADAKTPAAWTEYVIENLVDASSVHAADVDGDGDTDILGTSDSLDDIIWWENHGGAATTDPTMWVEHVIDSAFDGARRAYTADVDQDGDTDIVGAAIGNLTTTGFISWWENPGGAATTDGTVWTEHTIDSSFVGAATVFAADVDGDGDTDILGAAASADDIAWWENPGGAATTNPTMWTEHTIDADFNFALSVFAADVDGDGDTDILGTAAMAHEITWWENPGGAATTDPTMWTERTVDGSFGGAASVYAADVDGDGDTDVLGAAASGNEIAWWENDTIHRNAVFPVEHTLDNSLDFTTSVFAADVDGDGDTDILGVATFDDEITWWENPGGAATTVAAAWNGYTITDSFVGVRSVFATDVDADGDTDILGGALTGVTWWENPGGALTTVPAAWMEHTIYSSLFDGSFAVFAADVDGDGDTDILGVADGRSDVSWWENPGGASTTDGTPWTEHIIDDSFFGAFSVHAADVDGDGDIDILGAGNNDDISWWENPGGAATTDGTPWTEHTIDDSVDAAVGVFATDVDGDGDTDIVGAGFHFDDPDPDISWWENPGGAATTDGTPWIEHIIDDSFPFNESIHAADVDGDGDADVLSAAQSRDISWWENPGGVATTDGTPWTKHTPDDSLGDARSVYAADVDGDGDTDILGAVRETDIAWWENRGGQFGLPTTDTAGGFAPPGQLSEVLKIRATHNGRTGDNPVELVSFDLLLEASGGVPMSDAEANGLIESLRVYRDDETGPGAGSFQPGEDTQVASINPLSLTNGVQTVSFVDGDTEVEVPFGADRCYFVVVEVGGGGTIPSFLITHKTLNTSTADDADFDIPLKLAYTPEKTAVVVVSRPPVANAGPDQSFNAGGPGGVAATLDGSGSMDPDGDPLTYTWSGPFGTASGVSPTVQIPGGVHTVTLTVDDGRGGVDTDTVTITVRTIVVSPSSLMFTVTQGSRATSKPFTVRALGGTVSYSIARTSSWLNSSPAGGESSGEADTIMALADPGNLRPGSYTARLVVNGPGVIKQSLQATLIVTGAGGPPTPKPFENGVVDTADFTPFGEPGHATAPQSMVSIFGEDFVAGGEFRAESIPLPTMLGGVMVTFDGIKAGLFLVSPGLILAQMPARVTLPIATMVITNGGAKAASAPLEIQVAAHSPGIFTLTEDGVGQAIVVHAGTVDLAAPVGAVGNSRPAGEDDHLTIYMNGLGPLDPPLVDGHNSCEPDGVCLPDGSNVVLHHTLTKPVIRIGGVAVPAANVLFSGSSPASVAVNEVVFRMPAGVPAGDAVSLTVEMGGVVSKAVTIAVE